MNKEIKRLIEILTRNVNDWVTLQLIIPNDKLALEGDFQSFMASSDGCGGFTGHCSCSNNPCMTCSNAH